MKIIMILLLLMGGYFYWMKHGVEYELGEPSENGFYEVPLPKGQNNETVYVYAPLHCPKDATKRANDLASQLKQMNIPVKRIQSVNFTFPPDTDGSTVSRLNYLMKKELPLVFVSSKINSNPSISEVVNEVH